MAYRPTGFGSVFLLLTPLLSSIAGANTLSCGSLGDAADILRTAFFIQHSDTEYVETSIKALGSPNYRTREFTEHQLTRWLLSKNRSERLYWFYRLELLLRDQTDLEIRRRIRHLFTQINDSWEKIPWPFVLDCILQEIRSSSYVTQLVTAADHIFAKMNGETLTQWDDLSEEMLRAHNRVLDLYFGAIRSPREFTEDERREYLSAIQRTESALRSLTRLLETALRNAGAQILSVQLEDYPVQIPGPDGKDRPVTQYYKETLLIKFRLNELDLEAKVFPLGASVFSLYQRRWPQPIGAPHAQGPTLHPLSRLLPLAHLPNGLPLSTLNARPLDAGVYIVRQNKNAHYTLHLEIFKDTGKGAFYGVTTNAVQAIEFFLEDLLKLSYPTGKDLHIVDDKEAEVMSSLPSRVLGR